LNPQQILQKSGLEASGPAVPLSGGDMGEVWRLGDYVVKTHPNPPPGLFLAEERGLRQLAAAGARTPAVYWAGPEGIVLEYLPPGSDDWTGLAEMLAGLHARRQREYGGQEPLFIGRLPLAGGSGRDWRRFWLEKRLLPLIELTATRLGDLTAPLARFAEGFDWPAEGPVPIHGDLWSGNVLMSRRGAALIDPSAWVGERALDLAMMELFGGFPTEFWSVYRSLLPVPAEVAQATAAYQLYYLLVHVYFFGGGYVGSVGRVLERYRAL